MNNLDIARDYATRLAQTIRELKAGEDVAQDYACQKANLQAWLASLNPTVRAFAETALYNKLEAWGIYSI